MSCKINFYSVNESLFSRYIRHIGLLPARELTRRGMNLMVKKFKAGLLPFPQNVHLEVTNRCNLACPMCPYVSQAREKGSMEFALFRKIIGQCQRQYALEKMALMGLGEPLLNPELIEMSRYAKAHNIPHVFTSTNAALLGEKQAREIILKPGFDLLAISLDGASSGTYEKIRRGADFAKVIANVLRFIEIRKKLHQPRPRLVLQFLIMKENHHEKEAFIASWKDKLGRQDTIFLRDVDTFGGQVEDHRLPGQLPSRRRIPCVQLWRDLIVSWDGDVSVCCKDVNYRLKAGNLNQEALKNIWGNRQWNQLRYLHKMRQWDKINLCANCSEWNQ